MAKGGNWHMAGTYLGVRLRSSTFTTDRVVASLELSRRMTEIAAAYQGRGLPPKLTYGTATERRLAEKPHSAGTITDCAKWVERIGPNTLCENVNWQLVKQLADAALRPGYEPSTLKRAIVEVRATLMFAARHFGPRYGCPLPSFPRLEDSEARDVYVTPEHCLAMHAALLAKGEQLVADVLCLAVSEGPRRSELQKMRFEFVNLADGVVTLRDTKSSAASQVRDRIMSDIRPWAIDTLRRIHGRQGGIGPVFVRPDGAAFNSPNSFGSYVNKGLQEVAKDVGVQDWKSISLHVFRHTAATNHYLLTGDIHDVQTRFDWHDIASAERYLKQVPRVYAEQAARMYGLAGFWQSAHSKGWVELAQLSDIIDQNNCDKHHSGVSATPLSRE